MRRLVLILVCVALAGCGSSGAQVDLVRSSIPRAAAPTADARAAAAALDAFGFDLLRSSTSDPNVVLSPASVAVALGLVRPGARGQTAAEMDKAMHDLAADAHPTWLNALQAALASRTETVNDAMGNPQTITLRIANAAFGQRGLRLEPAYLDALASRFDAGVRLVDFEAATEPSRLAINDWVSGQTEGRIRELLAKGTLDPLTRLVLVDAIYLKAPWQRPFDPKATAPAAFTTSAGDVVQVPTMHAQAEYEYATGPGWRAIQLPYLGELSMVVVLPDDLAAFVRSADGSTLSSITNALDGHAAEVNLSMPTFAFETKTSLDAVLEALGMPSAFDPNRADFRGMTTQESLFIGRVVHDATIAVDEKGTVAAAATAVGMEATAAPEPVTLRLDRPFLFTIRDRPTNAIVFLGEVGDPSQAS